MNYEGNIFRPPSESDSILLQVTTGCSHNTCTFCGMYKQSRFGIKDEATIIADIDWAARHCRHRRRLFLCDGDALVIPHARLLRILEAIEQKLPWLERIGTYANTRSIRSKSPAQLGELRDHGLHIAYMGLETGDDATLKRVRKGADSAAMIEAGTMVRRAGMKLSVTVLLGIAGTERSLVHARETGRVLSALDPEYVGVLSLMLTPGTELFSAWQDGTFRLPDARGMLEELREMLEATDLSNGYFHANHASNYLPIKAKLPGDKAAALALLERALSGAVALKPEHLRAL